MSKQSRIPASSGPGPKPFNPDDQSDRLDLIRRRAHELWEKDGMPEGKHEEHWRHAEQELEEEGIVKNQTQSLPE
ncbi:DUF2934 domain-containing protein [Mycoplana rhizolycopersici]|uniref:DUF2934 domain-containing protein n=1 Tax=Mycoplana rhizolycopersici TaxID=2746702 RepID=A0ABX2QKM3_9HYPH|nr:DUF2934 domain-containing protein [Rhizobium rhizolycopersici]NVP58347.1 DUF2934 domain-containing protein [Rhizobium rhizolycopersici]